LIRTCRQVPVFSNVTLVPFPFGPLPEIKSNWPSGRVM
jgi:hypothetical protein